MITLLSQWGITVPDKTADSERVKRRSAPISYQPTIGGQHVEPADFLREGFTEFRAGNSIHKPGWSALHTLATPAAVMRTDKLKRVVDHARAVERFFGVTIKSAVENRFQPQGLVGVIHEVLTERYHLVAAGDRPNLDPSTRSQAIGDRPTGG